MTRLCSITHRLWDYYGVAAEWSDHRRGGHVGWTYVENLVMNRINYDELRDWAWRYTGEYPHAIKSCWYTYHHSHNGEKLVDFCFKDQETALLFKLRVGL